MIFAVKCPTTLCPNNSSVSLLRLTVTDSHALFRAWKKDLYHYEVVKLKLGISYVVQCQIFNKLVCEATKCIVKCRSKIQVPSYFQGSLHAYLLRFSQ